MIAQVEAHELTDAEADRMETFAAEAMETPEVQAALRVAVARITNGLYVGEVMVSGDDAEVRLVLADVHVVGTRKQMLAVAEGIANGCQVNSWWHKSYDSVGVQRVDENRDGMQITLDSGRYGTAACTLSSAQVEALVSAMRMRSFVDDIVTAQQAVADAERQLQDAQVAVRVAEARYNNVGATPSYAHANSHQKDPA